MQYFSFIGIGPKNGYKDVIYSFEDNSGEEVISHFVQEAIYTKHSKDIEGLYVFATKESRDKYGDSLIEQIGEDKHIEFIEINYEDSFDIYVSKLLEYMKENEEVILDVTHCFRHIPMKLLFALKYIELNKHVNILHLYYGMLQENKDKAIILDFIDDYQQQKLSDLLSQFDRTLVIKSSDVEALVDSTDGRITRFLEALTTFNKMVEYSEFDASIKAISKINNACNGIAKYKESYTLILPIVNSIKSKFKDCEDGNNEVQMKLALIRVLLNHERYQVAITFIDQFLREEIIRITLNPNSYTFNLEGY